KIGHCHNQCLITGNLAMTVHQLGCFNPQRLTASVQQFSAAVHYRFSYDSQCCSIGLDQPIRVIQDIADSNVTVSDTARQEEAIAVIQIRRIDLDIAQAIQSAAVIIQHAKRRYIEKIGGCNEVTVIDIFRTQHQAAVSFNTILVIECLQHVQSENTGASMDEPTSVADVLCGYLCR